MQAQQKYNMIADLMCHKHKVFVLNQWVPILMFIKLPGALRLNVQIGIMDAITNIQKIMSSSECMGMNSCVLCTTFYNLNAFNFPIVKEYINQIDFFLLCYCCCFFMKEPFIKCLLQEHGTDTVTMNKTVFIFLRALLGRMQVRKQLMSFPGVILRGTQT